MTGLDFDGLNPTEFEEFCFQLLSEMEEVRSVDWRKGTPKDASPADSGRDLEVQIERTDFDGTKHIETWFVDCKHYEKGVPPTALDGLLTWSNAERPHVALVIVSGFLSNPAKDYLRDYQENNRPPFRIKYWERPTLDKLTRDKSELLSRFLLTGGRSEAEIIAAEAEFFDRVWHERHLMNVMDHESGVSRMPDDIYKTALAAGERVRATHPDVRPVESDFEWGMWNGKLSALRWVLGSEWDFLDT